MNKAQIAALAVTLLSLSVLALVQLGGGERILIATTTSLYDTGVLDVIGQRFWEKHGVRPFFIPVGSGLALQRARAGDADVVLSHAPSLELQLARENLIAAREIIAYNFFAVVGPPEDPVGIKNRRPLEALRLIAEAGRAGEAIWISRGDRSGTHLKEEDLWRAAGFDPSQLQAETWWYLTSGQGMGATLMMANEKRAYVLTDVGTYLKYRGAGLVDLEALSERSEELLNVYSAMAIKPEVRGESNFDAALRFIEFLTSDEGQAIIGDFGLGDYGRPLFNPAVRLLRENTDPQLADWIRELAFLNK